MDTNRIIIKNYDLSSASVKDPTQVVGFTVVKAPKGPKTPIRIPAGGNGEAMLKDIFGEPSSEFTDLYEASTFLKSYDLFISAPYGNGTKVPIAYVTPRGVFASESLVTYNDGIENLLNGIPSKIDDVNNFEKESYNVLMDTRYPKSCGLSTANLDLSNDAYPSWNGTNAVIINLGLSLAETKDLFTILGKGDDKSFDMYMKHMPVSVASTENGDKSNAIKLTVSLPTESDKEAGFTTIEKVESVTTSSKLKVTANVDSADEIVGSAIFKDNKLRIELVGSASSDKADKYKLTVNNIAKFGTEANRKNITTSYVYKVKGADIYGSMFPKYPSERAIHITFSPFDPDTGYDSDVAEQRNIFKMRVFEEGAFHNSTKPVSIEGSLDVTARSASNAPIGFSSSNASYGTQNLLAVVTSKVIKTTEGFSSGFDCYAPVILDGGVRDLDTFTETKNDTEKTSADLYWIGWKEAAKEKYSCVNLFFKSDQAMEFDGTKALPTKFDDNFFGLADIHKLAGFIFNITPTQSFFESAEAPAQKLTKLDYGPSYWNICNVAIINSDRYGVFNSSMVGVRAEMQARIIEKRYGGVAPMFLNKDGLGGKLSIPGFERLKYEYDKDIQTKLDSLNFNPVIDDSSYGTLITGHKTCKGGSITDWSYIGHVCSFLEFEREVREVVMIPQIGKPNNDYYRTLRKQQVEQILARRLEASTRIWNAGVVDTSTAVGVNDLAAQRAKKFVINVMVKVDVFSEFVELNFTNVDLATNIG